MSGVTWSSTCALIRVPLTLPPESSRAPLATASSTREVTRSAAARSTSEPNTGAPSRGSPTDKDLALAAKRSTKRSAIFASTTMRSVDMQICPWLANAPKAAAATAASMSASSRTSNGDLPPSSKSTGFRCSAQILATILPTFEDPVKLTRRTAGCAIKVSTTRPASLGALLTTLTTPGAKPASRSRLPLAHGKTTSYIGRYDLAGDLAGHGRRLAQQAGAERAIEAGPHGRGSGL